MNTNGSLELLVLRLAVTNSIVDPWIYILLRKETLLGLLKIKMAISSGCVEKGDSTRNNRNTGEHNQSKYVKKPSLSPYTVAEPSHFNCQGLFILRSSNHFIMIFIVFCISFLWCQTNIMFYTCQCMTEKTRLSPKWFVVRPGPTILFTMGRKIKRQIYEIGNF